MPPTSTSRRLPKISSFRLTGAHLAPVLDTLMGTCATKPTCGSRSRPADTRTKRHRPASVAPHRRGRAESRPRVPLRYRAFTPTTSSSTFAVTPPATCGRCARIALDAGLLMSHRECATRYRGWLHLLSGLPSWRDSSRLVRDSRLPFGCRHHCNHCGHARQDAWRFGARSVRARRCGIEREPQSSRER